MTASTPSEPTNRFAVPLADLDAVHVTQLQMVELVGDAGQPPETGSASAAAGPEGDGDGD